MGGLRLKLSLKDLSAGKAVRQLAENIDRPQRMLQDVGVYVLSSFQRNFVEQGRPVPWKSSRRSIEQHGQILRDKGRLMNSITMRVYEKSLKVGTNVIYGAIHHFGGEIDKEVTVKSHVRYFKQIKASIGNRRPTYSTVVKAHTMKMNTTMPKRPYLMIQDSDWQPIKDIAYRYLIPLNIGE